LEYGSKDLELVDTEDTGAGILNIWREKEHSGWKQVQMYLRALICERRRLYDK